MCLPVHAGQHDGCPERHEVENHQQEGPRHPAPPRNCVGQACRDARRGHMGHMRYLLAAALTRHVQSHVTDWPERDSPSTPAPTTAQKTCAITVRRVPGDAGWRYKQTCGGREGASMQQVSGGGSGLLPPPAPAKSMWAANELQKGASCGLCSVTGARVCWLCRSPSLPAGQEAWTCVWQAACASGGNCCGPLQLCR